MKTLIVGRGEVGTALARVLSMYGPATIDKGDHATPQIEILHICFPYSEEFMSQVTRYQLEYKPLYTVIHSTVPVGTSRTVHAFHSPVRGLHPHLEAGLRTFVKFIGGEQASGVADYFRRAGLKVMLFDKQETTEASKLFDTEYYRMAIEFTHHVADFCRLHGLNFHEVYTLPNMTYNEGYAALGHPEFVRPVLQAIDGPIGGHCVMSNKVLLEMSELEKTAQ